MSGTFYVAGSPAMSSATDDWATPQATFDELNQEFGFVLDPCASSTNRKCSEWFGLDHPNPLLRDGLKQDWATVADSLGGAVFMNPPYGRDINTWVAKASEEAAKGITVVCLLPARTDTRWFHKYCIHHECRFIKGRLKFGAATASAPFPSVIVVMRHPIDLKEVA